jgi:hypothetical protein
VTKIIPATPNTIDRTEAKPNNKLPAGERRDELLDSELDTVTGGDKKQADAMKVFQQVLQDVSAP